MESPGLPRIHHNLPHIIEDEWFQEQLLKGEPPGSSILEPRTLDRGSAMEKVTGSRCCQESSLLDIAMELEPSVDEVLSPSQQSTYSTDERQFIKPCRFDGTGSFESFLKQFQICASHNRWTEKEKTDFLQCSLDKSAVQVLWDFPSMVDVTYENLIQRLRQRYGLESQVEIFRTQLKCRKQKYNESLLDLFQDVSRLVTLAYPASTRDITEILARDAFLDAMSDVELSLKVREEEPKTLSEAFRMATRLEIYRKSLIREDVFAEPRRNCYRQVRALKQEDAMAQLTVELQNYIATQQIEQERWMKMMEERLFPRPTFDGPKPRPTVGSKDRSGADQVAPWADKQVGDPATRGLSDNGQQTVRCYRCRRLGHTRRNCGQPRIADGRKMSAKCNTSSSANKSGSQHSLYVRCFINGRECSGLIDTGTEISLLPASIADGLQLTASSRKLRTANGKEILAKGEVVTRVKFNCRCKRVVRFVVSDEIEEVMLGMEFLSRCRLSLQRDELFVGRYRLRLSRANSAEVCHRVFVAENVEVSPLYMEELPSQDDDGEHERISSRAPLERRQVVRREVNDTRMTTVRNAADAQSTVDAVKKMRIAMEDSTSVEKTPATSREPTDTEDISTFDLEKIADSSKDVTALSADGTASARTTVVECESQEALQKHATEAHVRPTSFRRQKPPRKKKRKVRW